MKLYDAITKDAIIQEVFRICGANANTYTLRDVIARVNSALDRYLHLAFKAGGTHSFDDIKEATAPIDTQNIVSGTNAYKFSDFTEKILYLMKLTILNADAVESKLIPENFNNLRDSFLQVYDTSITGVPTHYCKYGDFIYLRPTPNYSEASGLRAYFNRPASKFVFNTFTVTIDAPGVFTLAAHGFTSALANTIMLETDGVLATGIAVDTIYYVVETVATNTFSAAATKGGTAITTSGSQSGIHYLTEMSKIPGIPVVHHPWLAQYASLPFLMEKSLPQMKAVAQQIQIGERAIIDFFANRNKDEKNIMTMNRIFNGR